MPADFLAEPQRFPACGIMFNAKILLILAQQLASHSAKDQHGPTICDLNLGVLMFEHLNAKRVKRLMSASLIVPLVQTRKILPGATKQEPIEHKVVFHPEVLMRGFPDSSINKSNVFDEEAKHFFVNLKDDHTLTTKGTENMKYSDVLSVDAGMSTMIMIGAGVKAHSFTTFMCFQSDQRSYPILGVCDTDPSACYRTGAKRWMDNRVSEEQ